MNIGVLGSGEVGKTLAAGFHSLGHSVFLGTRHPEMLDTWLVKNPGIQVTTFQNAGSFGDIIVLAVKGNIAVDLVKTLGVKNLSNKPVIDTTNPISEDQPINGVISFFTEQNESLMERLQNTLPEAHFVKAFNSVGSATMVNPQFSSGPPTMFICGNSEKAKQTVTTILEEFHWEVEDMGMVESARAIENLCKLWCIPGFLKNDWSHAFKMIH